jgi:hypothetical protein
MAVVFPIGLEVFGNCSSCVAGSTSGTTNPAAGTTESWTMSTGYTSFPTANFNASTTFTNPSATPPGNYFYIRDPADTTNEIVLVYSGGGGTTTWYVQRGMNGATVAHATGATWVQVISPYTLQNFKQAPGAAISAVTVGNTTTETIVAAYYPTSDEIEAGTAFDIYAFGHFTQGAKPVLAWRLCWGNTLALGGTQIAGIATATTGPNPTITQNAVSWGASTMTASGLSFDINGQVILLSATSVTSNINWWYSNANNTTSTAANALTSPASPVTISGSGPLLLTVQWGTATAANTLTATGPLIARVA